MRPTHLQTRYRYELTPRQREVIDLLARGLTNAEIADRLGVTLDGAKYHVREILGKLGAESREEAVARWREMPGRPRPWERFGLAWAISASAAAAAGVLVVAVVLALIASDGGDEAPADATAVPPSTATATSPPATSSALAECTSLGVTLSIETVPRAEDVLVRVSASGTTPCRMLGPFTLWLIRPPVDPAPDYPPEVNTHRSMKIALDFPFTGVLGEWSWRNWCAEPMPWVAWQAKAPGGSGPTVGLSNDFWPPCLQPDQPTSVAQERIFGRFDGDVTPAPQCLSTTFPEWLCTFATSVAGDAVAGRQDLFPKRISNDVFFLCDGDGGAQGLPAGSRVCDSQPANTSVRGYWLQTPALSATFVSEGDLESEVVAGLPPDAAISAIGCRRAEGYACGFFTLVMGGFGQPEVALIFRLESGREPRIIGARVLEDGPLPSSIDTPFGDLPLIAYPDRP